MFIGVHLDRPALTAALEHCLLTDEEMARGHSTWRRLRDPFPEF
ncbi:hypothetical protein [Caldilinea sp.]